MYLCIIDVHQHEAGSCILCHSSVCTTGRSRVYEQAIFIFISLQIGDAFPSPLHKSGGTYLESLCLDNRCDLTFP